MKLSVVIITYNEAENIADCIQSVVSIADEIVVVDSFSTDRTKEICQHFGVRFITNPFEGHIQQKNHAMNLARHDYVFSLDADERVSPSMKQAIKALKETGSPVHGFSFNRKNNYCGQWIRYCGWYPDRKLRLWNRKLGKWGGDNPHDKVIMDANREIKHINEDILHYAFKTVAEHKKQVIFFAEEAAKAAFKKGKKSNFLKIYLYPLYKFIKDYIFRLGILEGKNGFHICRGGAMQKYWKYKFLKEKWVE